MTIGDIRDRSRPLYLAHTSSVKSARAVVCRSARGGISMGQAFWLTSRIAVVALLLAAASSSACRAVSTDAGASTAPADIDRLKMLVPSQSHTMQDVGFHWTNLWFAGQQGNWPLARFYFDEARHHIQWTIQVRPIRSEE